MEVYCKSVMYYIFPVEIYCVALQTYLMYY